jgi:hypothetical protein
MLTVLWLQNLENSVTEPTNHTIKNYNAKVENSSLSLRVPETVTTKNPFQQRYNAPTM